MQKKKDLTTEQKILEVAEKLFLDKGFAATSTTEIAKKAGCNHAMLHYYFRTKEKLFQKIFENKIGLFAQAFLEPGNPEDDFETNLRRRVSAHFDMIRNNPKLPLLILTEMASNPERIALLRESLGSFPDKLFESLNKDLEKEIEKGTIRPVSGRNLLMNILSLNAFFFASLPVFSLMLGMPKGDTKAFIEQRREEITETIIHSLKP